MYTTHPHWTEVKSILKKLSEEGFTAWLAGGCVRDFLMQKAPKDFDVVTNAKPQEIEKLFPKALEVGKKFGIIILPFDGFQVEIATFRKDGEYKDGRHPESVSFATPEEDAKRRDFTINALFFDPEKKEIIDYVDGQLDIRKGIIRTVGAPEKRFDEDKLRVLRAFRFCSQLGFAIEEKTFLKARDFSLKPVSKERIRDELTKLLRGANAVEALSLIEQAGILSELLPETEESIYLKTGAGAELPPWILTKVLLQKSHELPSEVLLAFLLVPFLKSLGPARLDEFSERFKLSREDGNILDYIWRHWEPVANLAQRKTSYLLMAFSHRYGEYLFFFYETLARALNLSDWKKISALVKPVLPPDGKLPSAWVNAQDLMALGISGPQLGEALKKSFAWQLDGEVKNKNEILARLQK